MEWLQICAKLSEIPGWLIADWNGSRATKCSQSRHPYRLPRPRRPQWFPGGEADPFFSSAGSARSARARLPGRQGE